VQEYQSDCSSELSDTHKIHDEDVHIKITGPLNLLFPDILKNFIESKTQN
jgi:hypothetical protein